VMRKELVLRNGGVVKRLGNGVRVLLKGGGIIYYYQEAV